jgi:hypothetical protein
MLLMAESVLSDVNTTTTCDQAQFGFKDEKRKKCSKTVGVKISCRMPRVEAVGMHVRMSVSLEKRSGWWWKRKR